MLLIPHIEFYLENMAWVFPTTPRHQAIYFYTNFLTHFKENFLHGNKLRRLSLHRERPLFWTFLVNLKQHIKFVITNTLCSLYKIHVLAWISLAYE